MIEVGQEYRVLFADSLWLHLKVESDLGELPNGGQLWNCIDLSDGHQCMANTEKLLAGERVK